MIGDLKPYSAYKDSGVPWLGKVPEHWDVKRNKLFLREIQDRSEEGTEELLTVSQYTGVSRRRERLKADNSLLTNAESLVGYKKVAASDLVINIMLAWNGSLGISSISGIVSPAYCVFRFQDEVNPKFFHHLLRTPLFTGVFKTVSTGVVDSRLRLYPDELLRLPSLIPPLEEQTQIATFLDYADRRIRRYIRSKQKLIKLLEEQKQVIINQAVTRGLDPNVPLKPSGIEWLGDIPEHWEVCRLSGISNVVDPNPSHRNPVYVDDGFPFISTVEFVGTDDILLETSRRVAESTVIEQERRCHFSEGSIAFSRKGTIGAARILPNHLRFALLDSVCVINCKTQVNYNYIYRQLGSKVISTQCSELVRGAALKQVSVGKVRNLRVLIPPLSEQVKIAEFISHEATKIGQAIERARAEISLLHEFRTRLIADVVTGKLDVREAAAHLPVEVDDPEPLDDDLPEEDLGLDNDSEPDAAPEDEAA